MPHTLDLLIPPRTPRAVRRADPQMKRLVLAHDLLKREVLQDAGAPRQPELVPGVGPEIEQTA